MAVGVLSIQEIVVDNADITGQVQVDATVDSTDWTKSIIWVSRRGQTSSNARACYWTWEPTNPTGIGTTVRFKRHTSDLDTLNEWRFWVIRFAYGVQGVKWFLGSDLDEGNPDNHDLTSLGGAMNHLFYMPGGLRDVSTSGRDVQHCIHHEITSNTNLRSRIDDDGGSNSCDYYNVCVVRMDDATVQHVEDSSSGSDDDFDEDISSVTMSETIIIASSWIEPGIDNDEIFGQVYLDDATSVLGYRHDGGDADADNSIQAIEIPGITVDRGTFSIGNGVSSATPTIPDRPLALRTCHLVTADSNIQPAQNYAAKRWRQAACTVEFNSTTQLGVERASSSDQGLVWGAYETVLWPSAASPTARSSEYAGSLMGI